MILSLLKMLREILDVGNLNKDNLKHREKFMMIYSSRWYQYFFCGIAGYICIAPLFILEDPRDLWQVSHFTDVEMLCMLQLLDPILVLVFIGN